MLVETDDYTGIALWDDDCTDHLEDELPLPADLRLRVKAWLRDREESMGEQQSIGEAIKHDRAGHVLSHDLPTTLGDGYEISYHFETAHLRRELRDRDVRE